MVVSSLPAAISLVVSAFISAREGHSKWLHSVTVWVHPHWQIKPSPIDFGVGLEAPASELAAAIVIASATTRATLADMIFLHGLFTLALDFSHLALHAAGDQGEQRSQKHHHSANPH